jgi:hypothetical protein
MPTLTQARPKTVPIIPDDIEDEDYPSEVLDELDREFEIAKLQIASGELRPMTVAEIAAA